MKTYTISDKKAFIRLKREIQTWKQLVTDYKKTVQVADEPMFF